MAVFFTSLSLQAAKVRNLLSALQERHMRMQVTDACITEDDGVMPAAPRTCVSLSPELPCDKGCLDTAAVTQEDGAISGPDKDAAVDALICMAASERS